LIKRKPGFSGKMFWSLDIPFKTGFTVFQFLPLSLLSYSEITFSNLGNDNASPMFRSFSQQVSLRTL